jgi:hypothetical protein
MQFHTASLVVPHILLGSFSQDIKRGINSIKTL